MKETLPPFIIDTREQAPYLFEGHQTIRQTLKTGDYSLEGFTDKVAVERKSLSDAWGSMSNGRDRFERCALRLGEMDRAAIVIEGTLTQLCEVPSQIVKVTAASVVGGLISYAAHYGICVFFADNRSFGERVTARFLASWWKHRRGYGGK